MSARVPRLLGSGLGLGLVLHAAIYNYNLQ
jgi:hypothetical protein